MRTVDSMVLSIIVTVVIWPPPIVIVVISVKTTIRDVVKSGKVNVVGVGSTYGGRISSHGSSQETVGFGSVKICVPT